MVILVGLIVAFVLIAVFSNRAVRGCRWRAFPGTDHSNWRCIQCGATQTLPDGEKPARCLRPRA